MSREGVELILEKVLSDQSFRVSLFTDPRRACAPYDITESEFTELMGQPDTGKPPSDDTRPRRS